MDDLKSISSHLPVPAFVKCADSSRRTFGKIDIECDVLMRVREFCMRNILKWSKTSQTLLRGKRYCDWSACHNEMRQHLPARLSDQIVETIPKDSLRSVVMMNGYILAVAVPPYGRSRGPIQHMFYLPGPVADRPSRLSAQHGIAFLLKTKH